MTPSFQWEDDCRSSDLPIVYWGEEFLGEGTVLTVSPEHVSFVGNYLAAPGAMMRLIIRGPDDPWPISVPRAVVREVAGSTMRVDCLMVSDEDHARLRAWQSMPRSARGSVGHAGISRQPSGSSQEGVRSMAHILVIEDDDSVRALLRAMLEQVGHEVTDAPNGRLGLAAYRAKPADLVITDLRMPEMNGLDLILELTQAFLNVKVIAISGAPDRQQTLDMAKLLGVRQTLQKPFRRDVLLKAVDYELAH